MWFEKGINNPDCDFHDLQNIGMSTTKDGDIFVEVGCFIGESVHCLIRKSLESHKKVDIYAVDKFDLDFMLAEDSESYGLEAFRAVQADEFMVGCPERITPNQYIQSKGTYKCLLIDFFNKLREAGLDNYLTGCLVGNSWDMAKSFANKSIHYCFIDAGHSYNAVKNDLEAWYPKMKDDGIFCGHDWFSGESVRRAVTEFAVKNNLKIATSQSGWLLFKNMIGVEK